MASPSTAQEDHGDIPTPLVGEPQQQKPHDNFYTPNNRQFYATFEYPTLNSDEPSLRLLKIHPLGLGERKSTIINCELVNNVFLKDSRGRFSTISYCAGDPGKVETITVNGLQFRAFANLAHALRQARQYWNETHEDRELLLWVDQVCINQGDTAERSYQVSIMGDIYAASEQVLICLSTEQDPVGGIGWLYSALDRRLLNDDVDDFMTYLNLSWHDGDLHCEWDAFVKTILSSPWWTRAWIRQEFIRAHNAIFLASYESVDWKTLASIIKIYDKSISGFQLPERPFPHRFFSFVETYDNCQVCSPNNNEIWAATNRACNLLLAKESSKLKPHRFPDLLDNLEDVRFCQASDRRDKVYAFLGLSDHDYGIYPDYSPDVSRLDVYCALARNAIIYNGNLDILISAIFTRSAWHLDIPSWVPGWHNAPLYAKGRSAVIRAPIAKKVKFVFMADKEGRQDRILQVKGFREQVFRSSVNEFNKGDEVWMLHGASNIFVLRPHHEYHKVVGEIFDSYGAVHPRVAGLMEDLTRRIEIGHPFVQTINIC
jgi:hypothetical protein